MIQISSQDVQYNEWKNELNRAIKSPEALLHALELDPATRPDIDFNPLGFPLKVTHSFVSRMKKGDPNDPLLLQVLPLQQESQQIRGFTVDPVGDNSALVQPGLLHKYPGRVLLILTGACGIHCRYCFRRHFPYEQAGLNRQHWQQAVDYIRSDTSVKEVILSGGEPLLLSDEKLSVMLDELQSIPHLSCVRIHSRLIVTLPQRVDASFLRWIERSTIKIVLVLHTNHANEIDARLKQALNLLHSRNVMLLNQSVLLKGINDRLETLAELSERLIQCHVLPYYLHLLDKVQGAHHFDLDKTIALQLHHQLQQNLPGYWVPRLVTDQEGASGKLILR